jgi:hypothetical protein
MNILKIAEIFSVRKGYIYKFVGSYTNNDPASAVTEQLSILLKRNNFVSSVAEVQGKIYVYINEAFPEDTETEDFVLIGNIESAIEENSRKQEEYLRSLEPAPEPEPEPIPEPIPESEDPQNAS